VVANGDLEIVGSREERPFCRGERVPAVHALWSAQIRIDGLKILQQRSGCW